MAGRSIPKIAYDGIGKEYWTEGNSSFQQAQNEHSSTYVEFELLTLRGRSRAEQEENKEEIR